MLAQASGFAYVNHLYVPVLVPVAVCTARTSTGVVCAIVGWFLIMNMCELRMQTVMFFTCPAGRFVFSNSHC